MIAERRVKDVLFTWLVLPFSVSCLSSSLSSQAAIVVAVFAGGCTFSFSRLIQQVIVAFPHQPDNVRERGREKVVIDKAGRKMCVLNSNTDRCSITHTNLVSINIDESTDGTHIDGGYVGYITSDGVFKVEERRKATRDCLLLSDRV